MRHRLVLTVLAATFALGGAVSAQSPSPGASPEPSTTPFPWPTLPPPSDPAEAFVPSGPPHATVTAHGMTVDLWLSARSVAPGETAQAVVRITNLGRETAWGSTGPCLGRPLMVSDLSGVVAPGMTQSGNGAAFKQLLMDDTDVFFAAWDRAASRQVGRLTVVSLADCGPTGRTFDRVRPGETIEQRWTWYPVDPIDEGDAWLRPLSPGPIPVSYTWRMAGRGTRADVERDARPVSPITVSAELELTGADPGLLSMLELADRALVDEDFAAWVDEDPTRRDWTGAVVKAWPYQGADFASGPDFDGGALNGALEIGLTRDLPGRPGVTGSAWLDPWTGEVLGFTTR